MVSLPKVLHLVISLAPGGLERLVVDWTNARNRREPGSTSICCLDEMGALARQVDDGGVVCVEARRNRMPFDLAAVRRLGELLHGRFSILHAHNLAAWQYAVLAKVLGKTISSPTLRLIYTQHGANIHNLNLRDRIRARILVCFTDEIVAVSDATAMSMAKALWLPRNRIRVVVNGVAGSEETTDRRPQTLAHGQCGRGAPRRDNDNRSAYPCTVAARSAPPTFRSDVCGLRSVVFPPNALVIGTVGRLAQVKGQDRLIAAFAGLDRFLTSGITENQEPGTMNLPFLLLVGDGPERAALERQAQGFGVADRVIFAGYQADPASFLAAMDLFVLPSRSEGVSVALLEAMAAGVPVAVTDVGANREIVEEGKCGVVLPENEESWGGVFSAISRNITDTSARVEAARTRVRQHYSLGATLDGYEKLYSSC